MVRTRFAPSPTGYLHIGGVRTALFNWLFARRHGGEFVLRIDDTDVKRNVADALEPILEGFRWLGIDWDEGPGVGGEYGPYYQSQRLERYQAAAAVLLEHGLAYRDYATPEELQAEREEAQAQKQSFVYSRRWMAETAEQQAKFEAEGRAGVVRLKMPRKGTCTFEDRIRGPMAVEWAGEQDHVIQRADGSCLYHLASVVDDHDMRITHVIRAQEHLSNTPRQIFIARGLGYALPQYAHVPFVAEPGSKNKLSKRKLEKYLKNPDFAKLNEHGRRIAEQIGLEAAAETFNPVIVDFYREVGFLPQAIVNYLLLLGWSLDGKTEFFTREAMIAGFSLERVNNSPASFDPGKLSAFQDHYMQEVPIEQKVTMVLPFLQRAGFVPAQPPGETGRTRSSLPIKKDRHLATTPNAGEGEDGSQPVPRLQQAVRSILQAAGDRVKVAGDILDYTDFFTSDDELPYDEIAFEKRVRKPQEARGLLEKFKQRLVAEEPFDAATLEALLNEFVESEGIKIGQIIHALRVAVTGKAVGFGVFETLQILGKARTVARIERAIARI